MRTMLKTLRRAGAQVRVRPRHALLLAALAIALGLYACSSDSPTGTDSECGLSTTSLDFGAVVVGDSLERTFTITNNGSESISGSVAIDVSSGLGPFFVEIGGGPFELVPAQQRTVVVRFTPGAPGGANSSVHIGAGCSDVACSGIGDADAVCIVSTDTLDFGDVPVGDAAALDVTITNAGGSSVTGTASEDCGDFDLILGGSPYDLRSGDSLTIRVQFTPSNLGPQECFLETGSDSCADVIVVGTGTPPPVCDLNADALDFGSVAAGESATRSVTITNSGEGPLTGLLGLSGTCAEFSIEGDPAFVLGPDQSREVIVRFSPTSEGPERTCTLTFGTIRCADVALTGIGGPPAICVVTPAELDFGEVMMTDDIGTLVLTIRNQGQGTLAGTVTSPCEAFWFTENRSYSLTAGQAQAWSVRFAPFAEGAVVCTLSLGDPRCGVVVARGVGVPPPTCSLSPANIAFGVVDVGESADRFLRITNTGGGNVSGTVSIGSGVIAKANQGGRRDASASLSCDAFTIVGDASYSLDADESDSVLIRFAPLEEGEVECVLDAGSPLCDDPTATGNGFIAPQCEIEPASLSFGTIGIGRFVDRTLTIRNVGGSVLAGTVSEACDAFSIEGDASYSLAAGESRLVTLRFEPSVVGEAGCTFETGSELCADIDASGTATLFSACSLDVSLLEFGDVTIGQSADSTFSITNTGDLQLDGTIAVGGDAGCAAFSIVGNAAYDLAPNATANFTVRFAPTSAGPALCTIETGDGDCVDVSASGTGILAAECSLSVASLDFETVTVGDADTLAFSITNVGGSTLEGTVSESCAEFQIIGTATYALGANETQAFNVRFAPADEGPANCTIQTGASECDDLAASGVGELPPACEPSPGSLAFGSIAVGSSDTLTFSITNGGGGTLGGTVALSCADFSLLDPPTYLLAANQSQNFDVRFAPSVPGLATCPITLGSDLCDTLTATGTGVDAAQCSVSVSSVDYGTVTVGDCDSATVTIFNIGGQTLSSFATMSCSDFEIYSGAGIFQLPPGGSRPVRIRFEPTSTGLKNCTLTLGGNCPSVAISGTGGEPPSCSLSGALNFGSVRVNSADTLSFTITNSGAAVLTGTATENCSHFRIISGGSFTLGAGEDQNVAVEFLPTSPGAKSCAISVTGRLSSACDGLGPDLCGNVSCTGTGAALSCATSVAPLINASCIAGGCHPDNGIDLSCSNIRAVYAYTDPDSVLLSPILLKPSGQVDHGPFGNGPVSAEWDNDPAGSSYLTVLQWITEGANP
jgi:hypothetical protein